MNTKKIEQIKKNLADTFDILGRDHYSSSAILVPIICVDNEEHLLFEKRAPHIKQGNEICFPGGHYDPEKDSDFLETALRETQEELGISREEITIIGQLDTLVSPRGLIVECFLGLVHRESIESLTLEKNEVAEVFTIPVSWFKKNPPEKYHTRVEIQSSYVDKDGREKVLLPVKELGLPQHYQDKRSEWFHRVFVYHLKKDILWGLTAAVVENLIRKVFLSPQLQERDNERCV